MAFYLAELYSPKPAWLALDATARQQFFSAIGAGMEQLATLGIEIITMSATDASKPHAAPQSFFALWKLPHEAALDALLSGIAASGWHNYFDTQNATGPATDLPTHLGQLAGLN